MVDDTAYRVSDEVWRAIEPESARAADSEVVALSRVAFVVAGLVVATALVVWAGVVTPRFAAGDSGGGSANHATHVGEGEFDLRNQGVLTERVAGWDVPVDGVRVESVSPATAEVSPHASVHVIVRLQVSDCAAALAAVDADRTLEGPGIGLRVHRPWGTVRAVVHPPFSMREVVTLTCGTEEGADGPVVSDVPDPSVG